jgi:hypothetical protein
LNEANGKPTNVFIKSIDGSIHEISLGFLEGSFNKSWKTDEKKLR